MTTTMEPPEPGWRRRLSRSSSAVGRKLAGLPSSLSESSSAVARKVADLPQRLPDDVREQIGISAKRLAKVRSLKGAKKTVLEETERLFVVVMPRLAAAPLPITGWQARVAAGTAGGAAAAVEQAEELAALVSWGGALPSAPIVTAAVLTEWILELWIAISARVNQLNAAGRHVDPETLGRELAKAYLGGPSDGGRDSSSNDVQSVAVRAAERWAAGLIPGLGIAVDSFASQRTVARILAMPVTAHPPLGEPWHRAAGGAGRG